MPVLSNQRHERFAQELAKGKSASEAYVSAGYEESRSAASRLSANVNVQSRVSELKERAAVRAEISVANITDDLRRIAQKAENLGEAPGFSVARAALMDAAKLNGLIVDRTENVNIHHDITDEPLSDAEWEEQHGAGTEH